MKQVRSFLLLPTLLCVFVAGQAPAKNYTVNALTSGAPPVIDGTAGPTEWSIAASPGCTDFTQTLSGPPAAENPEIKAVFDATYLYVLYQVVNTTFVLDFSPTGGGRDPSGTAYTGDDFELFFAPAGPNFVVPGNSFYHVVFFPNQADNICYVSDEGSSTANFPGPTSWNATGDQAAFTYNSTTKLLTIEYRVPWTAFTVAPETMITYPASGTIWGVQLAEINNPGGGSTNYYVWEPDPAAGFITGRPFGTWTFTGTPSGPTPTPTVVPSPTPVPAIAYETQFPTTSTLQAVGPYACATDAAGGLYFVTFDAANSKLYYIADPVNAPTAIQAVNDASFAAFPTGRGLQGCSVDSLGNVYVTGDVGTPSPVVKKFGPAPSFTVNAAFAPDPAGTRRWLGNTLLTDDLIILVQFNALNIVNTSDGVQQVGLYVGNDSNYQRDTAVNPATYDIFCSRNGNAVAGSVDQWSGGNPLALPGYTRTALTFLDNLMAPSTFGDATMGIGFYGPRSWMLVNNKQDSRLDVYQITGTGAAAIASPVQQITGLESGAPLGPTCDAAMVYLNGTERLFITDFANNRVLIYQVPRPTSAQAIWMMMD